MKVFHVKQIKSEAEGSEIVCPCCGYTHDRLGDKIKSFSTKQLDNGLTQMYSVCLNCNKTISYLIRATLGKPTERYTISGDMEEIGKNSFKADEEDSNDFIKDEGEE